MISSWRAAITLVVCFYTAPARAYNLTCYNCKTSSKNDECFTNATLSEVKQCAQSEEYCMVHRIETVGVFSSLERSCAVTCKSRCGVWGEEEDEEHCRSCCKTSLCNIDSSAIRIYGNHFCIFVIISVLIMHIFQTAGIYQL